MRNRSSGSAKARSEPTDVTLFYSAGYCGERDPDAASATVRSVFSSSPKVADSPAMPAAVSRSDAAIALAREPAELQAAAADLRAHMPGDVIAPLAPIEAGRQKIRLLPGFGTSDSAECAQESRPGVRDFAAVLGEHDVASRGERVGDRDADPAGQMIVAGAREAQRIVARGARLMARRHLDRGHRLDAFQHGGDQRRGDAVVVETPLPGDREQARLDQPGEVLARGRARDARQERKLAAGERLAAHERAQHRGARRVAHERRDLDQVCCGDHGRLYRPGCTASKQRRFGARRTDRKRHAAQRLRGSRAPAIGRRTV